MQGKRVKKKPAKLDDLIQSYVNTKSDSGKKILLALIRLQDPKFKG